MSDTIRVMLLDMPQLLRDILESTIATQPDIELIAPQRTLRDPEPERTAPHVVLVGTDAPADADSKSRLLAHWPRARVIAVAVNGSEAFLYELRPHRTDLGQLSPVEILEAVRGDPLAGRWPYSQPRGEPH